MKQDGHAVQFPASRVLHFFTNHASQKWQTAKRWENAVDFPPLKNYHPVPLRVILGDGVPASVSSLPGQGLPAIILDAGLWQQNAKANYSLE